MNTYLIPVTQSYGYSYDYIACVHANTSSEAYELAKELSDVKYYDCIVFDDINSYEIFYEELDWI